MAKLEGSSANTQKPRAKKRKHSEDPDGEDGVESKSLIIEATQKKQVGSKRKSIDNSNKVKEKRKKTAEGNTGDDDENDDQDDDEQELPTTEQLRASEKPENTNAIVTVRQKKKLKHKQRLEAQKDQHCDKERQRNEEYLQKWKNARSEWKFEKLRQISIQQTCFDANKINEIFWSVASEYLSGSKGAAKATIIKLAEGVIDELDKQCEKAADDVERQKIIKSVKYQRARDLLQSFD